VGERKKIQTEGKESREKRRRLLKEGRAKKKHGPLH
jgi:hypothetical protein